MLTFSELLQDKDFLNRLIYEINKTSEGDKYVIPDKIPPLYRYSGISKYSVNDIKNCSLTMTAVREYNDMFDSGICIYSNEEDLQNLVDSDLKELSDCGIDITPHIESRKRFFRREAELKRNTVDYLGAHLCCFSTDDSSILMWAHYAKNNTGICVQYDTEEKDNLFKKWAFPVVYREKPINVSSLLYGEKSYKYRYELAVMISVLCKCSTWNYENEWRLISPLFPDDEKKTRYTLKNVPKVKEITFGYHFLRNCFGKEADDGKNNIIRILDFANENAIPIKLILQDTGKFSLLKQSVEINRLKLFLEKEFNGKIKSNIPYKTICSFFQREVCGMDI